MHPLALTLRRRRIHFKDFAAAIGYSEAHLSRILHGRQEPSPLFRALVADELSEAEATLFPDGDEPEAA